MHATAERITTTTTAPEAVADSEEPATRTARLYVFPLPPEVEDCRGYGNGIRQFSPPTSGKGCTKAWKALAEEVNAARETLNDVLPKPDWMGRRRGESLALLRRGIPDQIPAAMERYRLACGHLIDYDAPALPHIESIIRAACELSGHGDPVWYSPGKGRSFEDAVWGIAYRRIERALRGAF